MPVLTLSIGSNKDAVTHVRNGVSDLRSEFGNILCSRVFESEAVGFVGDNFLNLAAVVETEKSLADIIQILKALEDRYGRDRTLGKYSGRTLDIDILTYGDESGAELGILLSRPEITQNAFVLQPLSELQPEVIHSETGKSFSVLWSEYDKSSQRLWPVDFNWQD